MPDDVQIEKSEAVGTIEVKEEQRPKRKKFSKFIETHSTVIHALSALASVFLTIGLVFYSFQLFMLQSRLTELQFKQFVIDHTPNIGFDTRRSKPKISDGTFSINWKVVNGGGGYVIDLKNTVVVMSFEKDTDRVLKLTGIFKRIFPKSKIKKNSTIEFQTSVKDPIYKRLEKALRGGFLYIVLKTSYKIPAEISFSGVSKTDSTTQVLKWYNHEGQFFDATDSKHAFMIKRAHELGYLEN